MADLTTNIIPDANNKISCDILSEIAEDRVNKLKAINVYSADNPYGATHVNALQATGAQDDPLNCKGKGTGNFMDTSNGGSFCDINGHPTVPGSGRNAAFNRNKFNPSNQYEACFE